MWGHLLTFLGGPHACIGYRFSLVEYVIFVLVLALSASCDSLILAYMHRMKALVYTLVRNFEFEFAVPEEDIKASGTFIQRPALRSEAEKGAQLPLLIRPYRRTA